MKINAYSNYVDSGVQWIGKTPKHWMIGSIKRFFDVIGGATPKSEVESYWDGEVIWITPTDLYGVNGEQIKSSIRTITNEGLNSCGTRIVPSGSVILSTRAPIGSVAVAEVDLCTNQGCKSLIPAQDKCSGIFIANLLSVSTSELNVRGKGTTFLELSGDELSSFKVPFPPIKEQIAINKFVTFQKAKLDTLISKQEKLIDLLKEKRQAIISHAVTKGLDPDVQMKDSGVEWIGEIPSDWKILRVKHIFSERDERSKNGSEELYSMSKIKGLIPRSEISEKEARADSLEGYKKFYSGDLVMNKMQAWNGVFGFSSLNEGIVSPDYSVFFIVGDINPIFFTELFRTPLYSGIFHQSSRGMGTAFLRLNTSDFMDVRIPFPPKHKQDEISKILINELSKIDILISKTEISIELAKEHRSALISAAVTGKIDVRDFDVEEAA